MKDPAYIKLKEPILHEEGSTLRREAWLKHDHGMEERAPIHVGV